MHTKKDVTGVLPPKYLYLLIPGGTFKRILGTQPYVLFKFLKRIPRQKVLVVCKGRRRNKDKYKLSYQKLSGE